MTATLRKVSDVRNKDTWAYDVTQELLLRLLSYNRDTGILTWNERSEDLFENSKKDPKVSKRIWNTRFAGKEALAFKGRLGHHYVRIFGKSYSKSRVIWIMVHGRSPDGMVDHEDRNPENNRLANLRDVDRQTNSRNSSKYSTNTSGHTGVVWHSRDNRWAANIKVDGMCVHLGNFVNKVDAVNARKAAEVSYGFHENHGK